MTKQLVTVMHSPTGDNIPADVHERLTDEAAALGCYFWVQSAVNSGNDPEAERVQLNQSAPKLSKEAVTRLLDYATRHDLFIYVHGLS